MTSRYKQERWRTSGGGKTTAQELRRRGVGRRFRKGFTRPIVCSPVQGMGYGAEEPVNRRQCAGSRGRWHLLVLVGHYVLKCDEITVCDLDRPFAKQRQCSRFRGSKCASVIDYVKTTFWTTYAPPSTKPTQLVILVVMCHGHTVCTRHLN